MEAFGSTFNSFLRGGRTILLRLGLPKGSLQEPTLRLFRKAGYQIFLNERSYYPFIDDEEIEVVLMRAQEIPRYVQEGVIDAGLSGKDWILENEADVVKIADLVYAKQSSRPVKLVLAVAAESKMKSIADLEGKRIATEFVKITQKFLAAHGVRANVEFSYGATEAKVPRLADAIVDLTETGSSLRAHGLRALATLLESIPQLHANKGAWADPQKREKLEALALLLQGVLRAEGKVGLKMNLPREKMASVLALVPAMKQPTISPLYDENWVALEVIVDEQKARELIPLLKKVGAEDIIEYPLNKVIP